MVQIEFGQGCLVDKLSPTSFVLLVTSQTGMNNKEDAEEHRNKMLCIVFNPILLAVVDVSELTHRHLRLSTRRRDVWSIYKDGG